MIKEFSNYFDELSPRPQKSRNYSRPKSTISKPIRGSYSNRPKSRIEKSRSISVSKDFAFSARPFQEIRNTLDLTYEELKKIYLAKCSDLNIPNFPDQEKRFFNYCWLHFKDRKFCMSEAGLGSKCAKVIGEILRNNSNFSYIDLSKNSIKDSGAIDLLKSLKKSLFIVHLDISSNDITPEGSKIILEMIENSQSLVSLNIASHEGLHRNRLCAEGGASLSRILSSNQILSYLNVNGTSLGPEGLTLMLKGLEKNLTLQSLSLSSNAFGGKIIEKFCIVLVGTDIKELSLASNKIGNEGCEYLGLMLSGGYEGFCMLTKLNIADNEISTKGLSLLLAALRVNSQLKDCNLKKNNFTKGLSSNFFEVLTDNSSLEILDFSQCKLKCEGLGNIGEGLTKNKTLKKIVLSGNCIKDRGAEMIAFGLNKNGGLTAVDLSSNDIKNQGAMAFAKVLKHNKTLEVLLLRDNSIKDSGGRALCEVVRFNEKILKMSLDLNPMNFQFINEVKVFLKNNENSKLSAQVSIIQSTLDKTHVNGKDIEHVYSMIQQKIREQGDTENKLKNQGERLQAMKELEDAKMEEIKKLRDEIKSQSFALSSEIDMLNTQIHVRNT